MERITNPNRLLPESEVTISYLKYKQGKQTYFRLEMNDYWQGIKENTIRRLGYEPNRKGYEYIDSL